MRCKNCNSKNTKKNTNGELLCFNCVTCKKCSSKLQNTETYVVYNDVYCNLNCYYNDKNIPSYEKEDEL